MSQIERKYSNSFFSFPTEEKIIGFVNQVIADANTDGKIKEVAMASLNHQYNQFREMYQMDCVLGYVTVENDNTLYVVVFEGVKSEEGKYYQMYFDEEKNRHYIELVA